MIGNHSSYVIYVIHSNICFRCQHQHFWGAQRGQKISGRAKLIKVCAKRTKFAIFMLKLQIYRGKLGERQYFEGLMHHAPCTVGSGVKPPLFLFYPRPFY